MKRDDFCSSCQRTNISVSLRTLHAGILRQISKVENSAFVLGQLLVSLSMGMIFRWVCIRTAKRDKILWYSKTETITNLKDSYGELGLAYTGSGGWVCTFLPYFELCNIIVEAWKSVMMGPFIYYETWKILQIKLFAFLQKDGC